MNTRIPLSGLHTHSRTPASHAIPTCSPPTCSSALAGRTSLWQVASPPLRNAARSTRILSVGGLEGRSNFTASCLHCTSAKASPFPWLAFCAVRLQWHALAWLRELQREPHKRCFVGVGGNGGPVCNGVREAPPPNGPAARSSSQEKVHM